MSMETSCPSCHTTFRVTTEQLNAHQGDVRCGVCALLFNAFDSLAPAREDAAMPDAMQEPEAISVEPVPEEIVPAEEVAQDEETEVSLDLDEVLAPTPAPEAESALDFGAAIESVQASHTDITPAEFPPEAEHVSVEEEEISLDLDKVLGAVAEPEPAPVMPEIEEGAIEAGAAVEPVSEPVPESGLETVPEQKPQRVPAEVRAIEDIYADFAKVGIMAASNEPPPVMAEIPEGTGEDLEAADIVPRPAVEVWGAAEPSRKRRLGWLYGLGALPLLLLLAGQTAYFYRVELASRMPAMRTYLEQACGWIDCTVPLPHNADLLKIESSDLEADTEYPSKVTLATTVSNRASYRQTYPLLELTLTNHADQAIARRVFAPGEYLPAGSSIKGGMAANSETSVRLSLDLGDLNAVGYRLYVFYAAQR